MADDLRGVTLDVRLALLATLARFRRAWPPAEDAIEGTGSTAVLRRAEYAQRKDNAVEALLELLAKVLERPNDSGRIVELTGQFDDMIAEMSSAAFKIAIFKHS